MDDGALSPGGPVIVTPHLFSIEPADMYYANLPADVTLKD
jgi:hypothetical protein